MADAAEEMLTGLLAAARASVPDEVAGLLAERARALGAESATIFLIDHEQYVLVPVPRTHDGGGEPVGVDSTLAGRCFRQTSLLEADEGRRVWVPLLDGMERLGVLQLDFPGGKRRVPDEQLHAFAALVAELIMAKDAYGDLFARVRRRQQMSLAGEIAWNLLPPLTFGTDRLVISCVLAPAYDVGGDSFDYAIDANTARFAVFDAMGHGLDAGLLATVAIAAYRNSRREGADLASVVATIDAALAGAFGVGKFVTALLADLDLGSGRLLWHNAGHPAPLLLRGGRVVKSLHASAGLPLGLIDTLGGSITVSQESLEPGDRLLLYTDGVVEARSEDGEFFGLRRLADLVARQDAAGQPAPETMRRLMHAILAHQAGRLRDDATTMLVEWQGGGAERIAP
jgi:hypothetical protein